MTAYESRLSILPRVRYKSNVEFYIAEHLISTNDVMEDVKTSQESHKLFNQLKCDCLQT